MLEEPSGAHYGLALANSAGVKPGTLYPILVRLEDAGVVVGEWEQLDEAVAGRRRRRYYQLTRAGANEAQRLLSKVSAELAPPARSPRSVRSPSLVPR